MNHLSRHGRIPRHEFCSAKEPERELLTIARREQVPSFTWSITVVLASAAFSASCVSIVNPRHAGPAQLIGVINEPRSAAVRITTQNMDVREIRTDTSTRYKQWLTNAPWRVSTFVNAQSLTVGRCVKVTLRQDNLRAADLVEISMERADAKGNPCQSITR